MSYEVTASRRRPQRFEDLIGQDFVSATLQKSIEAGKIAHAYLFSGPRGCGKTTSARILAKALNCDKGPAPTPCGECLHCKEITKGVNLDVIEIDGASNTGVNDVRQIKDEVLFPPNSSRYKIYIIDEVHMLSTNAFNALLKTIEEPPPYVVFIFATTELHKVPATIKSRCQQFNFRLVPIELLKNALEGAAEETGIKADSEALYWIARQGNGSVRDSYTLFDQVAAFSDGHITFDKIRDKLGLTGFDQINTLVEFCAEKNPQNALSFLDEILQSGVSIEQFIVDSADYFRNLLFIKSGITKESLLGQSPERFSRKVLSVWGNDKIEHALEIMFQLFRDIRYSLDPRCETELAVARMCWLTDYVSPEEMKEAFNLAKSVIGSGGSIPRGFKGFSPADENGGKETVSRDEHYNGKTNTRYGFINKPVTEPTEKKTAEQNLKLESEKKTDSNIEENPGQTEQAKQTVEGNNNIGKITDIRDLPGALADFFINSKTMLSAIFSQTSNWVKQDGQISFTVEKPLQYNQMESEKALIQEAICHLTGESLSLSIKIKQTENEGQEEQVIPEQVEAVRSLFKGTVLST